MSKKNRPNPPRVLGPAPTPPQPPAAPVPPPPQPVVHGDCFAAFMNEAMSINNEIVARREFDREVVLFLNEKGLLVEWEAWRTEQKAKKKG